MVAHCAGVDVRQLTPLIAAALLLIGGSTSYAIDETVVGISLISAGLILLGAWLTIEVRMNHNTPISQQPESELDPEPLPFGRRDEA